MKGALLLFLFLATFSMAEGCSSQPMDQSEPYDVISSLNDFYAPFYGKSTTELSGKYQELVSLYNFKPIPGTNPPQYDVKEIIFRVNGGISKAKIKMVKGKGLAYIWDVADLPYSKDNPDVKKTLSRIAFIFKNDGNLRPAYFFPKHPRKSSTGWDSGTWNGTDLVGGTM